MDGVIFIKEVVIISLMGSGLLSVIMLALCAMMLGVYFVPTDTFARSFRHPSPLE